jgi:hypothetical protein
MVGRRQRHIFAYAEETGIDPLGLRSQLLLHLPKFQRPTGSDLYREMHRLAAICPKPPRQWLECPAEVVELSKLDFGTLPAETAKTYHEALHYVGSYRPGRHYALTHRGKVYCMGSVADFDLGHVRDKIGTYRAGVFSRFYAYRWAPKNIFSYFWGHLRPQLRQYDLMFSFINPNIGFTGNSHRAAQWVDFAHEAETRYMYDEDGDYRTMRYCLANPGGSQGRLGRRQYRSSSMELHPVMIMANVLQPDAKEVIPKVPYLFSRPKI